MESNSEAGPAGARAQGRLPRPKYKPTSQERALVSTMLAWNVDHATIARQMGISEAKLRRAFADELKFGVLNLRASVAVKVTDEALKGDKQSRRLLARQLELDSQNGAKSERAARPGAGSSFGSPDATADPQRRYSTAYNCLMDYYRSGRIVMHHPSGAVESDDNGKFHIHMKLGPDNITERILAASTNAAGKEAAPDEP
jgi:hypothetical protein